MSTDKVPASTESSVLAKEIRFLKVEKVKYMRPIILQADRQKAEKGD